ncbi:DNA repair protein RAD50 [Hypsibius exemplaris]|uniref:DNA repair protein RAD50 n=1 Tax=Hypsibius exemplaris TaxID=2072580 RepID=A0A1W0WKZ3_HYPEX|nr:DNA repair protein RAD50 [Hypsibius exemplaris]
MSTRTRTATGQQQRGVKRTAESLLADETLAPNTPLAAADEEDCRFGVALKTLDINGFRSFGELAADVGHIDWMSPVTLILGPNGTGKTTIIECLKFATTGEVPPNSNRGSAFINDPKASGQEKIRAQVALKFFGADNKEYVLTRTAEGKAGRNTRGGYDVKFKTLESTLTTYKGGRRLAAAQTVDQAGQLMQSILGVPKAILNSVIFCHQEESDWPLDQASKLKDKFDEIFAATKYIKALEAFRDLKKKDKVDLKAAEERKDQKRIFYKEAEVKILELDTSKKDAVALTESIDALTEAGNVLEMQQEKLQCRLDETAHTEKNLEKTTNELAAASSRAEDLLQRLGEEYPGTNDDLRHEMQRSKSVTGDKKRQLEKDKKWSNDVEKKLADLRKKSASIRESLGSLNAQSEQHKKHIVERDNLIRHLSRQFEMKMYMNIINDFIPEEIESFLKDFAIIVAQIEDRFAQQKLEADREMEDITHNMASRKQELENLLDTLKRLKKEVRDKDKQAGEIADELSDMQSQSTKLSALETKIATQDKALQDASALLDLVDLRRQIADHSDRRKTLNDEIKLLRALLQKKESQQGLHTQINMLEKQRNEKKDLSDKLRNKLNAFVDHVGVKLRSEDIKGTLDRKMKESADTAEEDRKTAGKLDTKIALKNSERAATKKELDATMSQIKVIEEDREKLCGSGDADIGDALKTADAEIGKLQGELAEWQGKAHVLKGFRDELQRTSGTPCCPTCHRGFEDESDATDLVDELNNTLRDVPQQVEIRQGKIAERNQKRDSMVAFAPEMKKLEGLRKTETDLKVKLKKIGEEATALVKEKADMEATAEKATALYQVCVLSQADALKLDGALTDLKKIEKQLESLNSQIDKSGDSRPLEVLKAEKDAKEAEVETGDAAVDVLREKLSEHERTVNKLKDDINALREQKLKITEKLQQRLKLEHQLTGLQADIAKAKDEETDLNQREQPMKDTCEALVLHRQQTQARLKEEQDVLEETRSVAKSGQKDLQAFAAKFKEYERKGVEDELQSVQAELASMAVDIQAKEQELAATRDNIRRMEKDLDNVSNRDQILQDNITLRDLREESKRLKRTQDELQSLLEKDLPQNVREDIKQLALQKSTCDQQLFQARGRQAELLKSIKVREKELEVDHYKHAKKNHVDASIHCAASELGFLSVLGLAMSDVEKFYKALDVSVMKFHSEKMESVNKLLREYWQDTYQGNDIDYIEIRSDADDSGIDNDKARRTYSYRVVMICGDRVLDMRGRCSAGQRVLACLLIRLSLAQAFAMNCGVLALDEPTTNLDRENCEKLAKALAKLIRSRLYEHQRTRFQLIIITHDSNFLNILNTDCTGPLVDSYYEISKDRNGKSRLKKQDYGGHI